MSEKTRLGTRMVNAQARATAEELSNSFFDLMGGDPPESEAQAKSDEQRLVRWEFRSFASPRDGVLNANPIDKVVATKGGDPTWCRCVSRDDGEILLIGSVGTANANAISTVETIVKGQIVKVDAFKHIISKQSAS